MQRMSRRRSGTGRWTGECRFNLLERVVWLAWLLLKKEARAETEAETVTLTLTVTQEAGSETIQNANNTSPIERACVFIKCQFRPQCPALAPAPDTLNNRYDIKDKARAI